MPMSNSRVKRFLASSRAPEAVVETALQTLWPLYQKAQHGRYEVGRQRIDGSAACSAISLATGLPAERIVIDSSRDHETFLMAPYGGLPFDTTLGGALLKAHWPSLEEGLKARFGPEWTQARDHVWECLRADVADRLRLPFWDDPFSGPRTGAGESVMTALFYFTAVAAVGDADRLSALAPLVRMLPMIVPIAQDPCDARGKLVKPPDVPTGWLVKLPPIAR